MLRRAAGIEGVLGAQSAAFAGWRDDMELLSETLRRAIRPWSLAAPGVLDVVDEVMQEVQRRSSADAAEDIHLDDIVNISSRAVAARADRRGIPARSTRDFKHHPYCFLRAVDVAIKRRIDHYGYYGGTGRKRIDRQPGGGHSEPCHSLPGGGRDPYGLSRYPSYKPSIASAGRAECRSEF